MGNANYTSTLKQIKGPKFLINICGSKALFQAHLTKWNLWKKYQHKYKTTLQTRCCDPHNLWVKTIKNTWEACHLMPIPSIYTNNAIVVKNFCGYNFKRVPTMDLRFWILSWIIFSGVPVLKCHCISLVSNKIESFL